tara:strand:- start:760 stop:1143 length:384 start_codon:yes stop_codon:yes gene_type:complete
MKQRISIQYTVEIEELPREVGRLLESAFNQYQLLQVDCRFNPSDGVLAHQTVERIECIRRAMAAVDHRLNDACNIINGYLAYKAQADGKIIPADGAHGPTPQLDELAEKIDKFKSLMDVPQENEISD